jgi:hypothetical protein
VHLLLELASLLLPKFHNNQLHPHHCQQIHSFEVKLLALFLKEADVGVLSRHGQICVKASLDLLRSKKEVFVAVDFCGLLGATDGRVRGEPPQQHAFVSIRSTPRIQDDPEAVDLIDSQAAKARELRAH